MNNGGLLVGLLLNRTRLGLELHKVPESDVHSLLFINDDVKNCVNFRRVTFVHM